MNVSDIGLICDAVTKLGIAGKQAFMVLMAIKALEIIVTGGVIAYAVTIILSTVRRTISLNSFSNSLGRLLPYKYYNEGELTEEAKKKITDFVLQNMSDKK